MMKCWRASQERMRTLVVEFAVQPEPLVFYDVILSQITARHALSLTPRYSFLTLSIRVQE